MGDSLPSLMPRTRLPGGTGRIDASPGARARASRPTACGSASAPTRPRSSSGSRAACPRAGGPAARRWSTSSSRSGWIRPARPTRPSRVYVGARRRARTRDLGEAFAVLESELRQSLAARSRQRTFVHAGVVGWRGQAIVVPGRSRSGKTTLVAELVRAGRRVPLGRVRRDRLARAGSPVRQAALDPRGGRLRSPRQPAERRGPGRDEAPRGRSRSAWWCSPPTSPGPSGGRRRSRRARP